MPLDALARQHPGGLDEFRITSASEIKQILRQLLDGAVPVNINGPDGTVLSTTLWTVDTLRGALSFSASADDPHLEQLVQQDEAVVVSYLDSVKLQFDATRLVLVHGRRQSALSCDFPEVVYRFQRRNTYRVRPLHRAAPVVRLDHPEQPRLSLALRVLDVSLGGCALFLPEDVPPVPAGASLPGCSVELDADTQFTATLRLQHLSSVPGEARGLRMGCEMLRLSPESERMLQRYIEQTQKRRRLLALD
ncbi:hypothetical protein ISF6_4416 [Piscinibacter sakaiensis]|uniref:Flagellar brake protein YcgR n=2 Tax=Piscinibacter sakaiensis TaxID=1547922 RepID=A0A0K8P6J4_PISS1|nr:hypothetical protein ISF6_4416 [Piscinibacter sakaiensis]